MVLTCIIKSDHLLVEDALTEDGEILVYFPAESLKRFQAPEEWTEAIKQTHREKQQEKEG